MGLVLYHEHNWNQAFRASSPQPSISTPITSAVHRHVLFRIAFCKLNLDGSRNGDEETKTETGLHIFLLHIQEKTYSKK